MDERKLELKDLYFGKTDAYNELMETGPEQFEKSFWQNEQYDIEDFFNGIKYYIYGDKGTGKTAFLKYMECRLSDKPENLVIPIRYKSEFDSDDRKNLQKGSSTINIQEEVVDVADVSEIKDCVNSWQLYLISRIIKGLKYKGEYQVFECNKEYETLYKLIESVYSDETYRIIPQINKGLADINLSVLNGINARVELEIGLEKEQKRVNYQKLAKKVIDLFGALNLVPDTYNNVWILFDELELSVQSKKMNKRDIQLVRDLILAIERLNNVCRHRNFPIHVIAAIRSEVINSVYSAGYEINKSVEDFGKEITWYIRGGKYEDSPLISMIIQKIRICEEKFDIKDEGDLWYKYFPKSINGMNSKEYVLRYTWHRPRDIVRLLNLAKDHARKSSCFTQDIFDATMREYSKKSWVETSEELRLIYDDNHLKAIKKLFSNIGVPFTLGDLRSRLEQLGEIYDYVEKFNERYRLIDVLEQLFSVGVIGNSGQRMRFKFLKDDDLDPIGKMIIHTPLRNYFAVQSSCKDDNTYSK